MEDEQELATKSATDLTNMLGKQVGYDYRENTYSFFGKKLKIHPSLVNFIDPVVRGVVNEVTRVGGTLARQGAFKGAKGLKASDSVATKIGTGAELLVRVGAPVAQVGLDIRRNVKDGYKEMNALREQATVLLAANNNGQASLGNVLTCKFTALCHKRATVYAQTRRGVLGSCIEAISNVPMLLTGYYQYKLDRIRNPEIAVNALPSTATEAERMAEYARYETMQGYGSPRKRGPSQTGKPERTDGFSMGNILGDMKEGVINNNPLLSRLTWLFDPEARRSMRRPESEADYQRNQDNTTLLPPVMSVAAGYLGDKLLGEEKERTVAWDYIMELQEYMDNHKHPDRNRISVHIKAVFEQHAKDLGKKYELEGSAYERALDAIAGSIEYGKLPAQALAEILDDKKIVTYGHKDADFGDTEDVQEQLTALGEKYNAKVNEKEFYKNVPFTRETLRTTFNAVPEAEKPFFSMLFPPSILEKAGVPAEQIKKYQEEGKQYFADELAGMVQFMVEYGRDELKKQGVKSKQLDALEALGEELQRSERYGENSGFLERNRPKVAEVVRNIATSVKDPNRLWQEFVARERGEKKEAVASKKPLEHASRRGDGEISRQE